jgi:hypothetical protein
MCLKKIYLLVVDQPHNEEASHSITYLITEKVFFPVTHIT